MDDENGYKDKLRKQKLLRLDPVGTVIQVVTGKPPFTPPEPAGADYSSWEWPFNVDKSNPRIKWAIGRACWGPHLKDESIIPLHGQCMEEDIPHGYYGFVIPNDIQEQADLYLHQVAKVDGLERVAPILDFEHMPKRPRRMSEKQEEEWEYNNPIGVRWAAQLKSWLDVVEAALGRKAILYSSLEAIKFVCDKFGNPPQWLTERDVWLAWYPYWWRINVVFKTWPPAMSIPKWMKRLIAVQYFDRGRQNHLDPNDLNVMNPAYLAELGVEL